MYCVSRCVSFSRPFENHKPMRETVDHAGRSPQESVIYFNFFFETQRLFIQIPIKCNTKKEAIIEIHRLDDLFSSCFIVVFFGCYCVVIEICCALLRVGQTRVQIRMEELKATRDAEKTTFHCCYCFSLFCMNVAFFSFLIP